MSNPTQEQLKVKSLGERRVPSPLKLYPYGTDQMSCYVPDEARVVLEAETMTGDVLEDNVLLEKAGPRERIYFEPGSTRAGIVSCGGLCPGINNVIRSLYMELHHRYGVKDVIGFRYGYEGLAPQNGGVEPIALTPDFVRYVHKQGGSCLGLGRGEQPVGVVVDTLERLGIDILFTIGGDGTQRAAHLIHEECQRRGRKISIIGVPKTIDNDVQFVDKTFGFETAVEVATQVLSAAHTEAIGARNGVGLVKLMGRDSGFIAAQASLASMEVNFCLVPEVPFEMNGPDGFLAHLEKRLDDRAHALVVVAEGCGASIAGNDAQRDASGNLRYAAGNSDIGPVMLNAIKSHFKAAGKPCTVKYFDPSYLIRALPANADDSVYCDYLARHAVHAGMAGKTDLIVGRRHGLFIHVPMETAVAQRRVIDPEGGLWFAVTETTGQGALRQLTEEELSRQVTHSVYPYVGS